MRSKLPVFSMIAASVLFFISFADSALSATFNLNYTTTYNFASIERTSASPGTSFINTPAVPAWLVYRHTFIGGPTRVIPHTLGYNLFTVPDRIVDSINSTINPGNTYRTENLQQRLYSVKGNYLPRLRAPADSAINVWTTVMRTSGIVPMFPASILNPDTHVLRTRGNITGIAGRTYRCTPDMAPVPLPAALPLMLVGLIMLGSIARRGIFKR